jgi:flavorubredoxin
MTVIQPASTPTPHELARAAELAALSVLDHALYTAAFALLAANPKIIDDDFEQHRYDRREVLADVIIKHAEVLQTILRHYRDAASQWPRYRGVDDPF